MRLTWSWPTAARPRTLAPEDWAARIWEEKSVLPRGNFAVPATVPPLAALPDEAAARLAGAQDPQFQTGPAGFTQAFLGPHDAPGMPTGALLSAFDPGRLIGYREPLPASYATIPASTITTLPHYGGQGCSALGLQTEDRVQGLPNTVPSDFFARPSQTVN